MVPSERQPVGPGQSRNAGAPAWQLCMAHRRNTSLRHRAHCTTHARQQQAPRYWWIHRGARCRSRQSSPTSTTAGYSRTNDPSRFELPRAARQTIWQPGRRNRYCRAPCIPRGSCRHGTRGLLPTRSRRRDVRPTVARTAARHPPSVPLYSGDLHLAGPWIDREENRFIRLLEAATANGVVALAAHDLWVLRVRKSP